MKKLTIMAAIAIFGAANGQSFGATAGFALLKEKLNHQPIIVQTVNFLPGQM
ncbi:hypothetical protein [Chryseobacterium taklimakanense]|uniref:hypothetical protein n=1 Tax=Chryseobacterium taklimakanense TaxID=536441 RepID=UPI0013DE21CD|nr:hypothetical protein [Chryseobacterium taklimakanense]